jgi:hypothetical protein
MAGSSSSRTIDLQELITGAARLELRALNAGVEYWQAWINQAAKLSNIASDTLQAIQDDKASLSDTARRLADFGKDNAEVFGALSTRLGKRYYEELGRLVDAAVAKVDESLPALDSNPQPGKPRSGRVKRARAKA